MACQSFLRYTEGAAQDRWQREPRLPSLTLFHVIFTAPPQKVGRPRKSQSVAA
jgi:hypothetical protein